MAQKVLIADDDPVVHESLGIYLKAEGFETVDAFDGVQALESITPEVVLCVLDIMMPYMDGFEVLQNMRRNRATRDIPVIMLTAKSQDADVFRGWQSGVDCYLTKPFTPVELVSFVNRIFDTEGGGRGGDKRYEIKL